jgi:hypothetical protein
MKIKTLILPLSLGLMAGHVLAETIVVDDQVVVRASDIARPAPGMKMDVVEKRFGEPQERHAAVGAPPISRWDYAGYSVFFEKDRVIHTVVIGS